MKNIKDFDTFSGTDGYLIIDGTDENTPGGKKLLSEINSVPPTTSANNGDVLTYSNIDGIGWAAPASGGGGLSRATATLSAVESSDWSQSVSISNNTYTKVTNKIDSTTEIVKIYVEQCDMPHAYVELETDGDDVESIPVFIGNSETNLRWMHPSYTFNGLQNVVVDGDENHDWVMQIPADSTIIVEIIGNFINIHCNRATLGHDGGGGGE